MRVFLTWLYIGLFAMAVPATAGTDHNGDGLCDVWQRHFDAWTLLPNDDDDLDGCSNLAESIAGTNPRDPAECVRVGDVSASASVVTVEVPSQLGKRYQLLSSPVPTGGTWVNEGAAKIGTGAMISFATPLGTGLNRKFYRVRTDDVDTDNDGLSDWAEGVVGTNPELAHSPTNASGGVASDGETLASVMSLVASVETEHGYEKVNKALPSPVGSPARVRLVRTVGTMPLTLPVETQGGAPEDTKSNASPADYAAITQVTVPAGQGTPSSPFLMPIQPVADNFDEVPEFLNVKIGDWAGAPAAKVCLCDANPTVEANRTLFVAYLGREAGVTSTATGLATALVRGDNDGATINLTFSNLTSAQNTAYLRVENDDLINVGLGQVSGRNWSIRAASVKVTDQAMLTALHQGQLYVQITTAENPTGEIRGYFNKASGSTNFSFNPGTHDSPPLGDAAWSAPAGGALERDIWRFLDQCTYGGTEELYNEVLAAVNAALSRGGSYLEGYEAWLDAQMALPNPSLMQLVVAADNEEFVLRNNKPIWAGNDPNFSGESYGVNRDSFGNVTSINTTANSTFNNNHPFHNNRRREQWTLAMQAKAQVRQRMAQALSEIVVISEMDATVQSRHYAAAHYWDMLANHAFGKYRTILENVTYSPMMGIYLSHLRNRAQYDAGGVSIFPDENYAREIMQLFSIGLILRHPDGSLVLDASGLPIPTYDNDDIAELARVMTGFCHGARHANAMVQRFNGLTMNAAANARVSGTIELQPTAFTDFNNGAGEAWHQAPWIYPMQVLGRTSTISATARPWHDFGAKTLLAGKVGETSLAGLTDTQLNALSTTQSHLRAAEDITAAHNMLAGDPTAATYNGHPNTPVNISRWLIQRFTTSNPSAGYLYRVSQVYRDTNGHLGEVLKAILLDYEARSLQLADSSISHGRMKEPLVHFISVMRGSRARTGMALTALRDLQHGFSDTDAMTLNGWPGGLSKTLTQAEVDKYVSNASRFRFGDYGNIIGQSPLRAPSVFNWFLPDYVVPGAMAEAGLFAPEMQIASETNLVSRVNQLWSFTWMNLDGMVIQPGVDLEDPPQVTGNATVQVKVGVGSSAPTGTGSYFTSRNLTFTASNWNVPQTVHVAAVDDSLREGPHTTTLSHTAASLDAAYNNPVLPSVNVGINDNEGAIGSVIVEETDGITVVAENTDPATFSDTYTVRLGSAPSAPVTIINTANVQLSLQPTMLSFDSSNWSIPQTVTVRAINDGFGSELVHLGYIGHAVTSADPNFAGAQVQDVIAYIGDSTSAGSNGITVRHTNGTTVVTEGGASDTFVFALNRAPTGNVTVNVGTNARVTRSSASLTFTPSNWWLPQVVSVTAVDDALVSGTQTFNLSLTSSGGGYTSSANASVTVRDNEGESAGSIVISESGGNTTVTEASPFSVSHTDSYTVSLSSPPTQNVTVTVFPQRHVAPMANHAKSMGYFAGDIPSSTSNMQKDRIVFDYGPEIEAYRARFQSAGGTASDVASNIDAHFAAVLATVDRFDLKWCGGQLKAQNPNLTLADLRNAAVVNPRKAVVLGTLFGYSTDRGTTNAAFLTESRRRVQIAAYLVCLSPQSFTLK